MKLPNVSILIVARNAENDLPKLFRTIQKLNYPKKKLEIIYVDDGSTDKSTSVAKKYSDKVFHFEKRQGRARVRNFALKKAKYDLITWIDADCKIVDRNWIQNMLKHLKGKVIGVAGTQLKPRKGLARISWYLPDLAVVAKKEKFASWAPTTSSLFLKKPLLDAGGFDEKLITSEDLELCWRLEKKGYKFKQIPEAKIIHNFRSTFESFAEQQFERGYFGGYMFRKYGKSFFAKIFNEFYIYFGIFLILAFLFNEILIVAALFPLFFFIGLGYLRFFPKFLAKYLREEKNFSGFLKLIALQYLRTVALLLGLLKYQIDNLFK